MEKITMTRRKMLRMSGVAAAAIPTAHVLLGSNALADELPHLSPDDAMAAALGYVHDTTTVDKAANPRHENSQVCSNCALVQGGDDEEWRPCAIFPGKLVSANGWCKSWAPKAS